MLAWCNYNAAQRNATGSGGMERKLRESTYSGILLHTKMCQSLKEGGIWASWKE